MTIINCRLQQISVGNNKDVQVVPPLAKRRMAQTVQSHITILIKRMFIEKVFINFKYISFLDVIPNFIQTVEIEAILGLKRILVYALLINKSCNGVIYKTAIFCKFNICLALNIPMGFPFTFSLSFGMEVFMSSNFLRPPNNQLSFLSRL